MIGEKSDPATTVLHVWASTEAAPNIKREVANDHLAFRQDTAMKSLIFILAFLVFMI